MKTTGRTHPLLSLPSLLMSFMAATGLFGSAARAQETVEPPPPPAARRQEQQGSFWRHPDYNAVVQVWECKEKGLCAKVVSLDPHDGKVRDIVGKILKKSAKALSDAEILQFQGMEAQLDLHKTPEGGWTGKIYWPFKQKSYGVDVAQLAADDLHVRGFLLALPIFGRSVDLKPAKPPILK